MMVVDHSCGSHLRALVSVFLLRHSHLLLNVRLHHWGTSNLLMWTQLPGFFSSRCFSPCLPVSFLIARNDSAQWTVKESRFTWSHEITRFYTLVRTGHMTGEKGPG
ncbi:unnamed protein product [Ectocarpus sp. 13 AM-2016]